MNREPFSLSSARAAATGARYSPVAVTCRPDTANDVARLSYSDGDTEVARAAQDSSEWHVDIEEGDYRFAARFPSAQYRNNDMERTVRPPFRRVPIEV